MYNADIGRPCVADLSGPSLKKVAMTQINNQKTVYLRSIVKTGAVEQDSLINDDQFTSPNTKIMKGGTADPKNPSSSLTLNKCL